MKVATIFRLVYGFLLIPMLVAGLAVSPCQAQDSEELDSSAKLSDEQLAQMLAPVALYPDVLLSQVLMASTYPIEIIEADRWVRRNQDLKGAALDAALLDQDWDPSVKAICHFPTILSPMSDRIAETTNLGNAFLAQEQEVMDMVQELRARAREQGNLASSSEQKVVVEKQTIIIRPVNPDVIYVPYYDPFYIYGPWWYPAYPPYYWYPSGGRVGVGLSYWPGIYFGFSFGSWSHFDWHRHHIYIDVNRRPRYVRQSHWRTDPGRWHHVPHHRRGVAYRDKVTARRFGQAPARIRDFDRDTRGFVDRSDRLRGTGQIQNDRGIRRDQQLTTERSLQLRQQNELLQRRAQERERAERLQQERQRSSLEQQQQQRLERERQDRTRIEREQQLRQQSHQIARERERMDRVQRQRSRDNVFNRVEEGRRERQSSTRGQSSRKALFDDNRTRDRR
ncbi:MAG TPA: DUF3300 domain-containing protein [Geopsychrobacteraceae bacterium]|nr:DUF3300 domain-containing protein [Geopsychrobacteraceae bacterium]